MTNVLYVIWSLGLGGAEQVVINLARGLDGTRFRPFVCCLNQKGIFAQELENQGIKVFEIRKKPGLDFSVAAKIADIIRENNIGIVHTHLWGANFWGRLAARAAGVPVVTTEHNVDVWKSPFHFLIDRYLLAGTSAFIAVSEEVGRFYSQKLGVPRKKIKVIYNGIQMGEGVGQGAEGAGQERLKKEFGIKEGEKIISVIGRLVPQKGIGVFLRAAGGGRGAEGAAGAKNSAKARACSRARAEPENRKIKILIVGDGPLLKSLKSQVARLKLEDRVIFTGLRRDVRDILRLTDVLVLPSTREGLPLILLEAMAAGCVVVATRAGGTPEVVEDGVNGFLVPVGNVVMLRERLDYVLSHFDQMREIRAHALQRLRHRFGLRQMMRAHEKVYEELIPKEERPRGEI